MLVRLQQRGGMRAYQTKTDVQLGSQKLQKNVAAQTLASHMGLMSGPGVQGSILSGMQLAVDDHGPTFRSPCCAS